MLISMAIHKNSQLELERAMIELMRRVIITIELNGLLRVFIKTW